LSSLYFPHPYEFSVMPAEILGSVYEQFLGKVIELTAGGHARVNPKPEVKKAGGVGLRTATLTVNHNAAGSPATYTLNCTGQAMIYLPLVMK
jgi:hypothetical protein